jgi:cadmium resistance protein CadD (predicted permease)
MSLVLLACTGFIAWWGTGVDDTLALSLLLKGRSRPARLAMIAGNVIGVLCVLLVASLVVLGAITIAPGVLDARVFNIPVQNLLGLIPIAIGGRALFNLATGRDADDDDDDDLPKATAARTLLLAAFFGFQVYLVNSADDLGVHLGILSSAIQPPFAWGAFLPLFAYWVGSLTGEITSVISAGWLAHHMRTRRTLELIAALIVTVVGVLVLMGVFEQFTR